MPLKDYRMLGRLLANVCRIRATTADQLMCQVGLYRGQAILMMILAERDSLTHSDIARELRISPAAATKVIKRLEKLHYLKRQPDPQDERVSRVYIEEEGRAIIDRIHQSFHELDQITFEDFSDEDLEEFQVLLTRIQTNLRNHRIDTET